jgi:hypothetical protein
MSGGVIHYLTCLGREDATDIKEVEARDVVKCPARHRTV